MLLGRLYPQNLLLLCFVIKEAVSEPAELMKIGWKPVNGQKANSSLTLGEQDVQSKYRTPTAIGVEAAAEQGEGEMPTATYGRFPPSKSCRK